MVPVYINIVRVNAIEKSDLSYEIQIRYLIKLHHENPLFSLVSFSEGSVHLYAVLRIRICRNRMFLGLPDPDR
jgi:hypothetical protein